MMRGSSYQAPEGISGYWISSRLGNMSDPCDLSCPEERNIAIQAVSDVSVAVFA